MNDVVENEIVEKLIISKDDFKEYFNSKNIITKEEYIEYLKLKF